MPEEPGLADVIAEQRELLSRMRAVADDLVDAAEAARMLGYASRYVIHANRRLGYFPGPDAHGKAARGRRAPLRLSRVLAELRSGARPSSAQLAAEWNVSQRTAERIIRAARTLLGA